MNLDESVRGNCFKSLSKRTLLLLSQHYYQIFRLQLVLPLKHHTNSDWELYYPIPVSFLSSVNVLSAVTIGECSYSPVHSTCTSKSTARQIEYSRHANAK